jgi:hypothetical protein
MLQKPWTPAPGFKPSGACFSGVTTFYDFANPWRRINVRIDPHTAIFYIMPGLADEKAKGE